MLELIGVARSIRSEECGVRISYFGFEKKKTDKLIPYNQISSVIVKAPTFLSEGFIHIYMIGNSQRPPVGSFQEYATNDNVVMFKKRDFNMQEACRMKDTIEHNIMTVNNHSVYSSDHHNVDTTVEIRKYNELLSEGIITLEEFEAKKKQLLGI